jgi:uncharacterized membrane protein
LLASAQKKRFMRTTRNVDHRDALSIFWVAAVLVLAFALRVYALDSRPLWWDEGLTLTYAYLPPAANVELARATEHLNPPLYNWLVGALTYWGGITVFSARLTSVYGGLLTVAATYAIAKMAFGPARGAGHRKGAYPVGAIALFLMAVAPMQIYHAQEAKGYTVETAALLVAMICWIRLHRWAISAQSSPSPRVVAVAAWPWWVGYTVAILLAMGTNYLAIFALIVANVFTVIVTIHARRHGVDRRELSGHWLRWLTVQAAGVAPLLPYMWATMGSTSQGLENTSIGLETPTPWGYLWFFLNTFITSERPGGQIGFLLTLLVLLLAVAGLLARIPPKWEAGRWFIGIWLLLPLAIGYLFQLKFAWFFPRYLLYIQPALLVLAAIGVARLTASGARLLVLPLLAVVLLLSAPLLHQHYHAPPAAAEDRDWPLLFDAIRPYIREGDTLIARTSWIPGYMATYLPPSPEPDWMLGYFDEATIDETLQNLLAIHDRVWQIDYQMPSLSENNDSAVWMRGQAAMAYSQQVGVAAAALFIARGSLQPGEESDQQISSFENGVHLRWAPLTAVVRPGDAVGLDLTWWTDRPVDVQLVRFLHIMDSEGALVAQIDREPVIGSSRSYEWAIGEQIIDPAALALPTTLPPGLYTMRLGLYDREHLTRVNLVAGDDYLVVGQLEIR